MTQPSLELISFVVCPFVMRARIVLEMKAVPYKLTQIDIEHKPDWFLAISPLAKVPVLRVDNDVVLFESQVIAEYLDEITPGSLHASDPLARARDRAWIEFATQLILSNFGHLVTKDAAAQASSRGNVDRLLGHLEHSVKGAPFFNGSEFRLVDAAYAPFFVQLNAVREAGGPDMLSAYPALQTWSSALLTHPIVCKVVSQEFAPALIALLRKKGCAYFVESNTEKANA